MYLNGFSVRIPEGYESSGYVELPHSTQYTLVLRNGRKRRCDAAVEIDGKHVGTWRINSQSSLRIERPVHDEARFTFYRSESAEARKVGEASIAHGDRGLVRVTFTPEKEREELCSTIWECSIPVSKEPTRRLANCDYMVPMAASASAEEPPFTHTSSRVGGVTGLSGHSDQEFITVRELDYDLSLQTVIHLRLVCKNGDEPRPLTAYSTPVPPPV